MKEKIELIVVDLKNKLEKNKNKINPLCIRLDKNFFDKKYMEENNITKESFFSIFNTIKEPVLYWFEFDTTITSKENIRSAYEVFLIENKKDSETYRNPSAVKSDYSKGTNILYVGKVKTGFWGRLVTHLGYNISPKTAGMQLVHWYDVKKFGDLMLNYVVLDKEMENLIAVMEVELAKELKPIIGKY